MSIPGERIRALRLRQRLTLDDVARCLNVGRQAIYKYEQGTVTNIPLDNLEKMAALFDTTPAYLAGWSDVDPSVTPRESYILREGEALRPSEVELLNAFRSADEITQNNIRKILGVN